MAFQIYKIEEKNGNEISQELLETVLTPNEVVFFCRNWMEENEYSENLRDWIEEVMRLEQIDEKIVRDTAEFKMGRYVTGNMNIMALKVVMTKDE